MSGKVVSLSAWKARGAKQEEVEASAETYSSQTPSGNALNIMMKSFDTTEKGDGVHRPLMLLCMSFEERLAGLRLQPNHKKIEEYRDLVESYDEQTVHHLMSQATDVQISTKPYFFKCLLEVAWSRVLGPIM
jgi:hypothetical protein